MACQLPSFEEIRAAIKARKYFLNPLQEPNQADVVSGLDLTQNAFGLAQVDVPERDRGDDKRRYTLHDANGVPMTDTFMNWRVSDKINRMFKSGRTEEEVEALRNDPDNVLKRDYGSAVHETSQRIGQIYYDSKVAGTKPDYSALQKEAADGEFPITATQFASLQKGVTKVVDEIFTVQNRIDPNAIPQIRFEQIIVDPTQDIAGTMDIVAIFSDSSATIYDFKTMSSIGNVVEKNGKRVLIDNDFIYSSKRQAWKEQMAGYRRILMAHYGIKNIRAARIVPIWVDIERTYNQRTKTSKLEKKLNQLMMGAEMSEFLRNISTGGEKTTVRFIDDFINSRYDQIQRLHSQMKGKDTAERDRIMTRIRDIELSIQDFTEELNINSLIDDAVFTARSLYKKIENNKPLDDAALNAAVHYLEAVLQLQAGLAENTRSLKEEFGEKGAKKIQETLDQRADAIKAIGMILGELKFIRMDRILSDVGDKYGKIRRQGTDVLLDDESGLRKTFMSSTESNNPFVRHAIDSIQQKYGQLRRDLEATDARIAKVEKEVEEYLKSKGESLSDLHKYLINNSGNFHSRLSSQFFEDKRKAIKDGDINFFLDNFKLRKHNNQGKTYKEWYNESYSQMKAFFEDKYENIRTQKGDKAFDAKVAEKLKEWRMRNDLSKDSVGDPLFPSAYYRSYWLEPNDKAYQKYESAEYKQIAAVPALKAYYDEMLSMVEEWRQIVGYDAIKSGNFFPKVRAEMLEKMSRGDFSAMGEDLRKIFAIRQDEDTFGNLNPITQEMEKDIPIFFTNPFLDANGKIDLSQQSKDIGASMRLFAKVAYNYRHMQQVEARVLAVKDILPSLRYVKRDKRGELVMDNHNDIAIQESSEGSDMTQKVFSAYVDYYLYGIKMKPAFNNPELTEAIRRAKNYFSLKTLGLGFIGAGASYAAARIAGYLEGKKGTIYTSEQWTEATKDMISKESSGKYHALGFFFGIHSTDMLEGIVQGRTRSMLGDKRYASKIQQYVNQRLLMRPYSYGDERLDNHIAAAMSKNYGVDENGDIARLENLPEGSKSIWELFTYDKDKGPELQLSEEHLYKVMDQFRLAVRAGQKGVKGTMSEEDIAYSSTDLLLNLVTQFKTWMPGILNERFGNLRYNDITKQATWGRYQALWAELSRNDMEEGAKTALTFIQATAAGLKRFGMLMLKENIIANKLGISYSAGAKAEEAEYKDYQRKYGDSRLTLQDYRRIRSGQLRALAYELQILLAVTGLILALGADWDDDGKPLWKENWVFHKLYQGLSRVRTEIAFTYMPGEYAKLIQSPIPLVSLAIQMERALTNVVDESRDTLFGENSPGDKTPFLHYTWKLVPGGYQIRRTFDLGQHGNEAR